MKDYNYLLDKQKEIIQDNELAKRDIKNNIEDLEVYEKSLIKYEACLEQYEQSLSKLKEENNKIK